MDSIARLEVPYHFVSDFQACQLDDADEFIAVFPDLALLQLKTHCFWWSAGCKSQALTGLDRHGAARNPARGPGGLEIEAAGKAINVEQFAAEVESRTKPALHGLEVYFA